MTIIDRRDNKKKSVGNRQRFIKRYKKRIKESIQENTSRKGITDALDDREITISDHDTNEPSFQHDDVRGRSKRVLTGNKTLKKGDKIDKPPEDDGTGPQGSDSGDGFDEFSFTLTKAEFLEIYFSDMELPDFIKEKLKGSTKEKWKRHGYTKDGIPSRLDLAKTLQQSLARRIATKSKRYLDDVDMRYKHFVKQPFPIKHAVMFCLMDVSYSMGRVEKDLAKRFFLLLYLFLEKNYENIEVRFVCHTQSAEECTEQEFFYGTKTGGTIVSSGLQKVNEIIDSDYNLDESNIYLSQVSDGDNFSSDAIDCKEEAEKLISKVQYFTYIQTDPTDRYQQFPEGSLMTMYKPLIEANSNFNGEIVKSPEDIYPALKKLFSGE